MNDIELTKKIKELKWEINLKEKTCKSDLVHYRIIKKKNFINLKSEWIGPDMPTVTTVINDIQQKAVKAVKEALKNE